MATYSVYSYDRREYDYYEAPGPGGTHAGAPPRPLVARGSVSPEAGTWKLPAGARKVGRGELPRGKIASSASAFGLGDLSESLSLPIAIGAVYLAWRFFR